MSVIAKNFSNAERILDELRKTYLDELPEKIVFIEKLFLGLIENAKNSEHYNQLFRAVHSLKGSAGSYGLHIVSNICHHIEDQLRQFEIGNTASWNNIISHCLECVDLLRKVAGGSGTDSSSLIHVENEFSQIVNSLRAKKISCLLVSSSRSIIQICRSILIEQPLEMSVMSDGYLALGRLLQENFDILITGRETHGLNGSALIAAVKLSKLNNVVSSILITSNSSLKISRDCDPDILVVRDGQFIDNLGSAVSSVVKSSIKSRELLLRT